MDYHIGQRAYQYDSLAITAIPHQEFYCKLHYLSAITVSGNQAATFLQGQLSNNILELRENALQKNLLCNIKGQIIAKLWVIYTQQQWLIICPGDLQHTILKTLATVAKLSKIQLNPSKQTIYGIIQHSTPQHPECFHLDGHSFISFSTMPNQPECPELAWHYHRLLQQDFEIYPESSCLFLPQQLALESDWVHFNKGCYRGQEIIARMHYLGKNKYEIRTTTLLNQNHLIPGQHILNQQHQPIGKILDWCPINTEEIYAILMVRKDSEQIHLSSQMGTLIDA